jgi:hypothetical protein
MSYHATPSRLAQAKAVGRVLVVAMNEVKFVAFSIIASAYGAILAHIPPRPIPNTSDPYADDQNVQRIMDEVGTLYRERRNYFIDTDTYAVFALYNRGVALPDQKTIIENTITEMGLQPFNSILYITPRDPTNLAHGTIFVDSLNRAGQKPIVYSEDRQVSSVDQPQRPIQPIQQSASTWI